MGSSVLGPLQINRKGLCSSTFWCLWRQGGCDYGETCHFKNIISLIFLEQS